LTTSAARTPSALTTACAAKATSRFLKDWGVHEAMTCFTLYSANFCWCVRTLRDAVAPKRYRQRTPALAAGLADHVWSLGLGLVMTDRPTTSAAPSEQDAIPISDDELLANWDATFARVTVQNLACDLRSFFSYAEASGWCRPGLAAGIKGPRVFPQESLPAGPSWDDVRRLLATADGDQPTDLRDRAILVLLAVYGFRAGEVRCLRLEALDWQNEQLRVTRGKTRSVHVYPLARPAGDAILRYLEGSRPRSAHREVFLTLRALFRPLGGTAPWGTWSAGACTPWASLCLITAPTSCAMPAPRTCSREASA